LLAARALPSPRTRWRNRRPLRRRASGRSYYYVHTDHLNTPRKVAQPTSGTLAWRWDTDPFGTAAPNENPSGLGTFVYNLRAPGQYYQAETGLNQNYYRDYDPLVGRYIESDPVGLRGGANTYAYVANRPLSDVDPGGLQSVPAWTLLSPPNPTIATVVCDSMGWPIPQLPLTPLQDKCWGDCALMHENSHIDDIIRLGYGTICHGQPVGTVVTVPLSENISSEKKAYAAEVACLERKLQTLTNCDVCRAEVQKRLNKIRPYVTNPPPPGP
jgi:RHS repeat-associated protein